MCSLYTLVVYLCWHLIGPPSLPSPPPKTRPHRRPRAVRRQQWPSRCGRPLPRPLGGQTRGQSGNPNVPKQNDEYIVYTHMQEKRERPIHLCPSNHKNTHDNSYKNNNMYIYNTTIVLLLLLPISLSTYTVLSVLDCFAVLRNLETARPTEQINKVGWVCSE